MNIQDFLSLRTSSHSAGNASKSTPRINLSLLDVTYLRTTLSIITIPRHYEAEPENNRKVASFIETEFKSFGLSTIRQGKYDNIVASSLSNPADAEILIGAHYDSVPRCPGADDNGSAVAGLLGAAKILTYYGNLPITYVAFNREEDGFLGSLDFVRNYLIPRGSKLKVAHILEMLGYTSKVPGSQSVPEGLPIDLGQYGDFIGIVMNDTSNHFADDIIQIAEKYSADLPVKTLQVFQGLENQATHLLRSDHSAFWSENISATMWTDTSEFRNPNYHKPTDTIDTLDYEFLKNVTMLLVMHVLHLLKINQVSTL